MPIPQWILIARQRCSRVGSCPARDLSRHPAHGKCAVRFCMDRGTPHASPHRIPWEVAVRIVQQGPRQHPEARQAGTTTTNLLRLVEHARTDGTGE